MLLLSLASIMFISKYNLFIAESSEALIRVAQQKGAWSYRALYRAFWCVCVRVCVCVCACVCVRVCVCVCTQISNFSSPRPHFMIGPTLLKKSFPCPTTDVASASQTRVAPIQNRPPRVWDGTASSQYIAVGPRTSISVQFHKCIPFQLQL